MHLKKSVKVGDNELVLETGKLAKQADGSVVVRYGDTMLLVTAVSAREKKDVDFLPLTVEYQEKLYSAGRIPGSYFKREGRLTEKETLTSPSGRPLLPPAVPGRLRLRDAGHRQRHLLRPGERGRHPRHHRRLRGAVVSRTSRSTAPSPASAWAAWAGSSSPTPPPSSASSSDLDLVMAVQPRGHRDGRGRRGGGHRGGHGGRARVRQEPRSQPVLDAPGRRCAASSRRRSRDYDKPAAADEDAAQAKVRELAMDGHQVAGYGINEKHDALRRALARRRRRRRASSRSRWARRFTPQVEKHAKAVVEDLKYDHMRELTVNGGRIGGRRARRGPRRSPARWACSPRVHGSRALHPRRDPGAGGGHARHQRGRAAARAARAA